MSDFVKHICGVKHFRRKCRGCGGEIWTQQSAENAICEGCDLPKLKGVGRDNVGTPRSFRDYHGGGVD